MLGHPSTTHRLLRATVAGGLATAAGTGAHLLSGGTVSTPGVLGALAGLLVPIWLMAGQERRFAALAGAQLAGQQLVHAWLEWAAAPAAPSGLTHAPLPDDVSLYGHVLAAAAIAGWLRAGERRLWDASRRAARALAAYWRWAQTHSPGQVAPTLLIVRPTEPADVAPGTVLRHVLVRRGPPLPG